MSVFDSPFNQVFRNPFGTPFNGEATGAWTPALWFLASEQGVWYDPSDMTTMFQDSAGTTPVTAVEQPVGLILDKRLGAIAGPELLVNGGFDADTNWSKGTGWSISGGRAIHTGATADYINQGSITPGVWYECRIDVAVASGAGYPQLYLGNAPAIALMTAPGVYTYRAKANSGALGYALRGVGECEINSFSVKELPGNHASQPTAAQKPKLSARKNWLTYSEDFSNAAWAKGANAAVTANTQVAPDGATTADTYTSSGAADALWYSPSGMVASAPYTFSIRLKQGTGRWVKIVVGANGYQCWVDTQTATLGTAAAYGTGTLIGATVTALADGWMVVRLSGTTPGTSAYTQLNSVTADAVTTQASGTCYVWGAQFEYGSAATTYQRIAAATDYDTVGFPLYLAFDGVDDFLSTGNIDFTATDKMTVVAGVLKGAAAEGIIAELSTQYNLNNGSFALQSRAADTSTLFIRGDVATSAVSSASNFPVGALKVITATSSIASNWQHIIRHNGVQEGLAGTNVGTGNFGNYPLYIGRRGGTSSPFNGRIYSLIVRGAATALADIENAESFVAEKTGVTL